MIRPEAIDVYREKRSTRTFVGRLTKSDGLFIFEYEKKYAYSRNALPLGPDLPITQRIHKSESLFESFEDRIPSRKNPAYVEYCEKFNISEQEKDEFILIATIARKGPSSFIFEAKNKAEYSDVDYLKFREELELSLRDFAAIFSISLGSLQKLEKGNSGGKEVLKRIEIYDKFPEVALYELKKNGKLIHSDRQERLEKILNEKLNFMRKKKK